MHHPSDRQFPRRKNQVALEDAAVIDGTDPRPDDFRTYVSWFCASVTIGAIAFLIGAAFLTLYQDAFIGVLAFVLALLGGSLGIFLWRMDWGED